MTGSEGGTAVLDGQAGCMPHTHARRAYVVLLTYGGVFGNLSKQRAETELNRK